MIVCRSVVCHDRSWTHLSRIGGNAKSAVRGTNWQKFGGGATERSATWSEWIKRTWSRTMPRRHDGSSR